MNEFCRKHLALSAELFTELDYIRRKRNEIHLQGLTTTARSYTSLQIGKAGNTVIKMLDQLEAMKA